MYYYSLYAFLFLPKEKINKDFVTVDIRRTIKGWKNGWSVGTKHTSLSTRWLWLQQSWAGPPAYSSYSPFFLGFWTHKHKPCQACLCESLNTCVLVVYTRAWICFHIILSYFGQKHSCWLLYKWKDWTKICKLYFVYVWMKIDEGIKPVCVWRKIEIVPFGCFAYYILAIVARSR